MGEGRKEGKVCDGVMERRNGYDEGIEEGIMEEREVMEEGKGCECGGMKERSCVCNNAEGRKE